MKLFCLISVLFSSFTFNLKETNKSFSYLTDEEPDITPSVVVPVIPPIGPIDPVVPEITDKSTSFADAFMLTYYSSITTKKRILGTNWTGETFGHTMVLSCFLK